MPVDSLDTQKDQQATPQTSPRRTSSWSAACTHAIPRTTTWIMCRWWSTPASADTNTITGNTWKAMMAPMLLVFGQGAEQEPRALVRGVGEEQEGRSHRFEKEKAKPGPQHQQGEGKL